MNYIQMVMPQMQGVVMSDYGSGTITPKIRDLILPLRKISQNFSISCISIIITKILSVIIIFSIRQLIPHQKL